MAKSSFTRLAYDAAQVRRVAKLVMGKDVIEAQQILALDTHIASPILAKVIKSAAANTVNNEAPTKTSCMSKR
jgi:ribosomal protein L22